MHTDFRQERRWKQAVAFELSTAVLEWHAATPEERKKLCVKTAVLAKEDTHHLEELQQYGSDSTQCDEQDVQKQLLHANEPATENSPLTFPRLVSHRTPLLDQPPSRPVISLSELPLDQQLPLSAKERTAPALLSGLVPDLSVYEPPAPPNSQEEVYRSRRIELCSPLHSRLTPVSALMDSKPLLLSTLNPAQKRKWGTQDEWQDVSNLHPPEKRQTSVPFADAKAGSSMCLNASCWMELD